MEKLDGDVQRIAKQRIWSEAEGRRIVAAWRRSGVSRAEFGRRYGIPVHRLYYWLTKVGPRSPVTERGPVPFHPVRVLPDRLDAGSTAPIEIRVIRVLRGFAPEELRAVLAALESHGCDVHADGGGPDLRGRGTV